MAKQSLELSEAHPWDCNWWSLGHLIELSCCDETSSGSANCSSTPVWPCISPYRPLFLPASVRAFFRGVPFSCNNCLLNSGLVISKTGPLWISPDHNRNIDYPLHPLPPRNKSLAPLWDGLLNFHRMELIVSAFITTPPLAPVSVHSR